MSWLSWSGPASCRVHCMGVQAAASSASAIAGSRRRGMSFGWTATMPRVFTVYGMSDSGNCYKVKLCLEQLALPYRWVEVDSARGETRSLKFMAMNANGKVPTLCLEDGTFLPES